MADDAIDIDDDGARRRKRRSPSKRKSPGKRRSTRRANLLYNLAWLAGGLAVGLPLLAIVIYAVSRF